MDFLEKVIGFFHDQFKRLSVSGKRRLALICTTAVSILLTISVFMSMGNSRKQEEFDEFGEPERRRINVAIPAEELFLPEEPDFIPGVLLERERRSSWTEVDAEEHWQDPLRLGEHYWRVRIETAIDEFLERIP